MAFRDVLFGSLIALLGISGGIIITQIDGRIEVNREEISALDDAVDAVEKQLAAIDENFRRSEVPSVPPPELLALATVEITSLDDGDSVMLRVLVSGRSSGVYRSENLNLYLLVFPLGTDRWWVQSIPVVKPDGSWTSSVIFGRDGEEDIGEVFILLAIITEEKLLPAQIFMEADGLPLSEAEDAVVGLVRT